MIQQLLSTIAGSFISMRDDNNPEVPTGALWFGMNELNLRSLIADPPKFVLEAKGNSAWSARIESPSGEYVEVALIQFKKDERTRQRPDVMWGEWTIHLRGQGTEANPDGMNLVFLATHDYVWVKGLSSTAAPIVPSAQLPPAPPVDDWNSSANQTKHMTELHRIEAEMGFPMDAGRFDAYMTGRNKNLAEVHDDELNRAGFDTDPCGGANKVPL